MSQKKTPGIEDEETARLMNRVKRKIVMPQLREGRPIGRLYYIDISRVENDAQYEKRSDILAMFNKGVWYSLIKFRQTKYYAYLVYEKKTTRIEALIKVAKYYRLFRSMKMNGFKVDQDDIRSFPCIFASRNIISRFDGHHRVSIARFFGFKEVPVLLITSKDILELGDLPNDIDSFIRKLPEPNIQALRSYGQPTPRQERR